MDSPAERLLREQMPALRVIAFLTGLVIAAGTVFSAIETFVVPRSVQDVLNRVVFRGMRKLFFFPFRWVKDYEGRDRLMSFYAPVALLTLLPVWYALVLIGYALMFWGAGANNLLQAFKSSGSSLFTLGFATPAGFFASALTISEAALGLILVALLIAYLPTMYAAFSRREAAVTMLEIRAGNPPSATEMILRYHRIHGMEHLKDIWTVWEAWFADIEESHTSLPALVFFRSPQPNRSWITAAGTILDAASLTLAIVDTPHEPQADLCIRAGFIALRRIADFFRVQYDAEPRRGDPISVTRQEFDLACDELAEKGVPIKPNRDEAWLDFAGWRVNYDTVLLAMAKITMAPSSLWTGDRMY
jgi:hypothetical protein